MSNSSILISNYSGIIMRKSISASSEDQFTVNSITADRKLNSLVPLHLFNHQEHTNKRKFPTLHTKW